jgi:hypothetical protein
VLLRDPFRGVHCIGGGRISGVGVGVGVGEGRRG